MIKIQRDFTPARTIRALQRPAKQINPYKPVSLAKKKMKSFSDFAKELYDRAESWLFERNLRKLQKQPRKFSTKPKTAAIEKFLAERNIIAAFDNNFQVAKMVKDCVEHMEEAGIYCHDIDIFLIPSGPSFVDGYAISTGGPNNRKLMFISENIASLSNKNQSTRNKAHLIYHEFGHILNFVKLDIYGEDKLEAIDRAFKSANKKRIKSEVSPLAVKNEVEFVTEVFAGIMDGTKYSPDIMALYRKLGGPIPKESYMKTLKLNLSA